MVTIPQTEIFDCRHTVALTVTMKKAVTKIASRNKVTFPVAVRHLLQVALDAEDEVA